MSPPTHNSHIYDIIHLVYYMRIILQRIKKALLLTYKVNSGKAKVTEEDRREIRCRSIPCYCSVFSYNTGVFFTVYGIQAQLAETFVDDVFGGRLMSTVVCLECGNVSGWKIIVF